MGSYYADKLNAAFPIWDGTNDQCGLVRLATHVPGAFHADLHVVPREGWWLDGLWGEAGAALLGPILDVSVLPINERIELAQLGRMRRSNRNNNPDMILGVHYQTPEQQAREREIREKIPRCSTPGFDVEAPKAFKESEAGRKGILSEVNRLQAHVHYKYGLWLRPTFSSAPWHKGHMHLEPELFEPGTWSPDLFQVVRHWHARMCAEIVVPTNESAKRLSQPVSAWVDLSPLNHYSGGRDRLFRCLNGREKKRPDGTSTGFRKSLPKPELLSPEYRAWRERSGRDSNFRFTAEMIEAERKLIAAELEEIERAKAAGRPVPITIATPPRKRRDNEPMPANASEYGPIGQLLMASGWLGTEWKGNAIRAYCPWHREHSSGDEFDAFYFPGRDGWWCQHSSHNDRKGPPKTVADLLPLAPERGRQAYEAEKTKRHQKVLEERAREQAEREAKKPQILKLDPSKRTGYTSTRKALQALVEEAPDDDRNRIRDAVGGNLLRLNVHPQEVVGILKAVEKERYAEVRVTKLVELLGKKRCPGKAALRRYAGRLGFLRFLQALDEDGLVDLSSLIDYARECLDKPTIQALRERAEECGINDQKLANAILRPCSCRVYKQVMGGYNTQTRAYEPEITESTLVCEGYAVCSNCLVSNLRLTVGLISSMDENKKHMSWTHRKIAKAQAYAISGFRNFGELREFLTQFSQEAPSARDGVSESTRFIGAAEDGSPALLWACFNSTNDYEVTRTMVDEPKWAHLKEHKDTRYAHKVTDEEMKTFLRREIVFYVLRLQAVMATLRDRDMDGYVAALEVLRRTRLIQRGKGEYAPPWPRRAQVREVAQELREDPPIDLDEVFEPEYTLVHQASNYPVAKQRFPFSVNQVIQADRRFAKAREYLEDPDADADMYEQLERRAQAERRARELGIAVPIPA